MAEPEWTKRISNRVVCGYYYLLFLINAIIAVFSVLFLIGVVPFLNLPKGMMISNGFMGILVLALAVVNSLFLYLVCDRSLRS
jgi:hypothetical protein